MRAEIDKRQAGSSRGTDVVVLNMKHISVCHVLQNAAVQPKVPIVHLDAMRRRVSENEARRKQNARRVNRNVSADAQNLFNYLHSIVDATKWTDDDAILINDAVIIRAPFTGECVARANGAPIDDSALQYVARLVAAFEDKKKQSKTN
jgi:hypothetical protein